MSSRRIARAARAGAAAVLIVGALAPAARGAEQTRLVYGFITEAEATPIAIEYNQPSFGIPSTPTFEIRTFHTQTQSDSGPTSHGLASVVWPGDIAGNAPPQLAYDQFVLPYIQPIVDRMPEQVRDQLFQPVSEGIREGLAEAPPYPVRAEQFYPPQPGDRTSNEVGAGIGMSARADDGIAQAQSSGSRAEFPGLYEAGNLNARSFSGIENGIASARGSTEIKDLSLFGGMIVLESFTNTIHTTSDGVKATLDGTIKIAGLTVTYPEGDGTTTMEIVSLDESGVVIGGESRMNWDQARAFFDEQLAPRGLTIEVLENEQSITGAAGARAIAGLSIRMDGRFLAAMRDQFPEPIRSWLITPSDSPLSPIYQALPPDFDPALGLIDSLIQLDQSLTLVLGNVEVGGTASPPFTFAPPPAVTPPATTPPPPVVLPGGPITLPPATTPPTSGTPIIGGVPIAVSVLGVPSGLVALGIILAIAGAFGARALADRATRRALVAAGTICPLEDR
jgi:hypothetical protein